MTATLPSIVPSATTTPPPTRTGRLRPRHGALGALLVATVCFVVLIAVPWIYLVPWRPKELPASSVEAAFIAAKLSLSAVLFAIGAALIAREASAPLWRSPSAGSVPDQRT